MMERFQAHCLRSRALMVLVPTSPQKLPTSSVGAQYTISRSSQRRPRGQGHKSKKFQGFRPIGPLVPAQKPTNLIPLSLVTRLVKDSACTEVCAINSLHASMNTVFHACNAKLTRVATINGAHLPSECRTTYLTRYAVRPNTRPHCLATQKITYNQRQQLKKE
jgi:hypothetical protein